MSLSSALHVACSGLFASQVGLQVAGNNIANANTPGYLRQEAVLIPSASQTLGGLTLGLGVEVAAIIQKTDRFLAERLRGAISDLSNSETRESAYLQLETLISELGESDLSTSLTEFFSALQDVLNQPEDLAVRDFAVLQGAALADQIRRLDQRLCSLRDDLNEEVENAAKDINRLLQEVAELNVKVVTVEGGDTSGSDAVGLRDQRQNALAELAALVDIRSVEQSDGSVSVFAGGEFLVFHGEHRSVRVGYERADGSDAATVLLADTDSPLHASSGKLAGLYAARDEIVGSFQESLDALASTLVFEFNKVHASGQGLRGYRELTSERSVDDADATLDQAGLPFTPSNGSFRVLVRNVRTGLSRTSDVWIPLNGLDDDITLSRLAAALDAIDGIEAEVTPERQLRIASESPDVEFAFAGDSSGILAALGVNTFFTGSSAADVGIRDLLRRDPALLAASRGGIGVDADNAVLLAGFGDQPLESQDGCSILETYERIVGKVAQGSSAAQAVSEGFRVFQQTLEGQQLAVSGVSIDEEAIRMLAFQRAFQASARVIQAVNELLEILVSL